MKDRSDLQTTSASINNQKMNITSISDPTYTNRAKMYALSYAHFEDDEGTVKQQLSKLFETSLKITLPDEPTIAPVVKICSGKFGDYQCNNAMDCWAKVKGKNTEFKASEMIESSSVTGPGFVNVTLPNKWIAKTIQKMLEKGMRIWAPKLRVSRAVVDFSSPNIAKELHVGHLMSTIIGDIIARLLEYSNVEVLRRNHVGDWGTQFGMLIEYLFEMFPDWENAGEQAIGDLQAFYKASKLKFESDPVFKAKSQQGVVLLQGGDKKYLKAWSTICEISRQEFHQLYERLGVSLMEKSESFYKPYIPKVLEGLSNQGLVEENDEARVIFIEAEEIPLIVVKRDGAYNYASTDLTALWYRLNEEKAEWILYVTDDGQEKHFKMSFYLLLLFFWLQVAKRAGWLPADENLYPKASHLMFGVVRGDDKKRLRTRFGDVIRLVDLLDGAKTRCKAELVNRGKAEEWTADELEQIAEAIGYGAVKYMDLKANILTGYKFDFDLMLNDKGNTAVCLQYAHARICSIIERSGQDIEELKKLDEEEERTLGLHIQFAEVVEETCLTLRPNVLCDYLYNLSEHFVIGSPKQTSRLLLCEATAVVMRQGFHLLGIVPVNKI
ncbi:hypothetical protein MKW98_029816 [Papaver atlanticum]|uniref:arginine--tRNA ligase n=1 Tax=Papaver atlanticum TaxID=357466 RepID=A0AAD4XXI7_9MAGN|nr:hypothetical protein MKW98_029816 [Papaver atlanticum]